MVITISKLRIHWGIMTHSSKGFHWVYLFLEFLMAKTKTHFLSSGAFVLETFDSGQYAIQTQIFKSTRETLLSAYTY